MLTIRAPHGTRIICSRFRILLSLGSLYCHPAVEHSWSLALYRHL